MIWITPQSENVVCTLASGNIKKANVKAVPETLKVERAWGVSFPPNLGAPSQTKFNKLYSLSESSDKGIRYFSGTATYQKRIYISKDYVHPDISLELDLGRVCVVAEELSMARIWVYYGELHSALIWGMLSGQEKMIYRYKLPIYG